PILERGPGLRSSDRGLPDENPSCRRLVLRVFVRSLPQVSEKSPILRVLVVDDESLIRWSIAETLADAGHTVIEAGDGATAVQALTASAEPVDAVLLDYRLPDSNDLALLANIRRLSPHSPVILMTAYGTPE